MNNAPAKMEVSLTAEMKEAINGAFGSGKPIVIAYVDEDGKPQVSYRGSTQAFSASQLAIWVRNPQGRILESIAKNPSVALVYGDFNPDDRRFLMLRGNARRETDAASSDLIYDNAHEFERSQDPERNGVAVVIDLTSVTGFFGGERIDMSASKS